MSHEDIPILVVDDAKFSSAIIAKALRSGGFGNVRFTNNPLQALRSIEKRPAGILIADWLMPMMDGLELARRVKALDDERGHFTYVMLLTARDDIQAMQQALHEGVDDFLNKANLRGQLLPRVFAAQRIAERENELLGTNQTLRNKIQELTTADTIDPATGLGNVRFTSDRITELLRDIEARGGAACLLLAGISNYEAIAEQHDNKTVDALMTAFATRLGRLVRPLDIVTRPDSSTFAVIMRQPALEHCSTNCFQRVFDALYMHTFSLDDGLVPVVVGVGICGADATTGHPSAGELMQCARHALEDSLSTGRIAVRRFTPSQQHSTLEG
jgi:phosphoserine phosphatase RsbU/P